jgi:hypothetical protein
MDFLARLWVPYACLTNHYSKSDINAFLIQNNKAGDKVYPPYFKI